MHLPQNKGGMTAAKINAKMQWRLQAYDKSGSKVKNLSWYHYNKISGLYQQLQKCDRAEIVQHGIFLVLSWQSSFYPLQQSAKICT